MGPEGNRLYPVGKAFKDWMAFYSREIKNRVEFGVEII